MERGQGEAMKGGARPRSGPIARTEAQQRAAGGVVRAQHRVKRSVGTVVGEPSVLPPPGLTVFEQDQWAYYAPLLVQTGRMTLEARDTLAKYCTALGQVAQIKSEMADPSYRVVMLSVTVDGAGNEHVTAKTNPLNVALRQWLETARHYEADLLLNPATAIRVPVPTPAEETSEKAAVHDFYREHPRVSM